MESRTRKPKGTSHEGFGILNAYGDMWTTDIFATEAQAHAHVKQFWKGINLDRPFKYEVVWAKQHTTFVRALEANGGGHG